MKHDKKWLLQCYADMLLIQELDKAAVNLQRTGFLHTYPPASGHEAIAVAIGKLLLPNDIFTPYYRDHGTLLLRGLTPLEILNYWSGDNRIKLSGANDLPMAIPIATQCSHAVGIAYALKLKKSPNIVLCSLGDGATSKGDFYESINFASIHNLPVIFLISNNQWAISVPLKMQSGSVNLTDKALAVDMTASIADGTNFLETYKALKEAINICRNQQKPILLEAKTYRLGNHTTADDYKRYIPQQEFEQAILKCPVRKMANLLNLQKEEDTNIKNKIRKKLENYINEFHKTPPPQPTDMFKNLYRDMPDEILLQMQELEKKHYV